MIITKTEHPYIVRVEGICGGKPIIKGSRIPVWLIAGWFKDGYSPEQIQKETYPHLSLAQIYDALSYYYDHQQEIDSDIAANTPTEKELDDRRNRWQKRRSL
jgi:uncharacterized protein (DUF433 family)